MINTLAGEDITNGLFRTREKYIVDPLVPLSNSTNPYDSNAMSLLVKNGPGNLFSAYGVNKSAAERFFQIHNKASLVSSGNVPYKGLSFPVPASGYISLGSQIFTKLGEFFPLGITIGWSTTKDTYTAATGTDHIIGSRYL